MEGAHGHFNLWVFQIQVKIRQVHGHHEALVGNHRVGQAADIEIGVIRQPDFSFAAGDEELHGQLFLGQSRGVNEYLFNSGHVGQGHSSANRVITGHHAPAEHIQALVFDLLVQDDLGVGGHFRILAQENHPHTIEFGQLGVEELAGNSAQEGIRQLH